MNVCFARRINRVVVVLLVLGCACLVGAGAEDEAAIKTPQKATIQFSNGRMIRGTLLSVNDKEVRLQLDREGTAPAKYKIDSIKAIQTSDGIWTYNKDKKRFESGKRPAATGTLIEDTGGVIAEGVGADAQEALKDAFRTAIRQVVGTLVDGETLVKDDKVISDKVLTYNDGIITKYDKISEKTADGLVRIKIKAVVERRNLVARLKEFKVTIKEIEGKDVAATVLTRQEARANATELLRKELNELPKVLIADARKVNASDYDEDSKTLRVDVFVKVDQEKYKAFLRRLLPLLGKINLVSGVAFVECKPYEGGKAQKIRRGKYANLPVLDGFRNTSAKGFANHELPPDQKGWFLWVMTNIDPLAVHTRWDVFLVDSNLRQSLDGLNVQASVQVSLVDAEGKTVAEEEVPLTDDKHHWLLTSSSSTDANICLAPLALYVPQGGYLDYKPLEMYRRRIDITVAELDKVKDIKCVVSLRPAKENGLAGEVMFAPPKTDSRKGKGPGSRKEKR
jgi:hypothetical protein